MSIGDFLVKILKYRNVFILSNLWKAVIYSLVFSVVYSILLILFGLFFFFALFTHINQDVWTDIFNF